MHDLQAKLVKLGDRSALGSELGIALAQRLVEPRSFDEVGCASPVQPEPL
jgi:hypothetical protein